jgi:hypothetical protein
MSALDEYGKRIAAAAREAGIAYCVVAEDGQWLYRVRLVREDGVPADEDMTPGAFAAILEVPRPGADTNTNAKKNE